MNFSVIYKSGKTSQNTIKSLSNSSISILPFESDQNLDIPNFIIKRLNSELICIQPENISRFSQNIDKLKALYKCPYPSCGLRYRYNYLLRHLIYYHKEKLEHLPAPLDDGTCKRPVLSQLPKKRIQHDPAFIGWLNSVQKQAEILRHKNCETFIPSDLSHIKRNSSDALFDSHTLSSARQKTLRLQRISSDSNFQMNDSKSNRFIRNTCIIKQLETATKPTGINYLYDTNVFDEQVSSASQSPPSKRSSIPPIDGMNHLHFSITNNTDDITANTQHFRPQIFSIENRSSVTQTSDDTDLPSGYASSNKDCLIGPAGLILNSTTLKNNNNAKTRLVMIKTQSLNKSPDDEKILRKQHKELEPNGIVSHQHKKRRRSLSVSTKKIVTNTISSTNDENALSLEENNPESEPSYNPQSSFVLHPNSVDLARRFARPRVKVIYACPIKNCPVACSSEAAFQRHFDRDHLKNQLSGVIMFPRRDETSGPQFPTPVPEEGSSEVVNVEELDDGLLLESLDLVYSSNKPSTDIKTNIKPFIETHQIDSNPDHLKHISNTNYNLNETEPLFQNAVELNVESIMLNKSNDLPRQPTVLNDEENRSLLQALDLIPDTLLDELLSMDTGTVHENVAHFTNLLNGDELINVDGEDDLKFPGQFEADEVDSVISVTASSGSRRFQSLSASHSFMDDGFITPPPSRIHSSLNTSRRCKYDLIMHGQHLNNSNSLETQFRNPIMKNLFDDSTNSSPENGFTTSTRLGTICSPSRSCVYQQKLSTVRSRRRNASVSPPPQSHVIQPTFDRQDSPQNLLTGSWCDSIHRSSFDDCLRYSKRKQRVDISFEDAASILQRRVGELDSSSISRSGPNFHPGLLSSMYSVAVGSDECARTSFRANTLLADYIKRRRTVLKQRVESASSINTQIPTKASKHTSLNLPNRTSNSNNVFFPRPATGGTWSWNRQLSSGSKSTTVNNDAYNLIEHLSLEGLPKSNLTLFQ